MRNLLLAFIVCTSVTMSACAQNRITGNGKYKTQKVEVSSGFNAINVKGSPEVHYTQSTGRPSVEIYGASNVIPYVEVFVENGTLIVKYKDNTHFKNPGKLEIRVSAPDVTTMKVNGSGDIYIAGGIVTDQDLTFQVHGSGDIDGSNIQCRNFSLNVHGSGDISLKDVNCGNISAEVHGSADIELSGKARNAKYEVNGSGDITAHKLVADNVEAYVHGSGDISCHAVEKLKGKVNGSGDVEYTGSPEIDFPRKGLRRL